MLSSFLKIFLLRRKSVVQFDFEIIRKKALAGPRVNELLSHFDAIASGKTQVPKLPVEASSVFLSQGIEIKNYHNLMQRNMGTFNRHAFASIPFFLEETIRIGIALSRLSNAEHYNREKPMAFYSISSADATQARTLAEYTKGVIRTLSDSPNESNAQEFKRLLSHTYSYFHQGPFTDMSPTFFKNHYATILRNKRISVIWEDTAFQMYGNNRTEQIAYACRILADDGLIIFLEKMGNENIDEYNKREQSKDFSFKAKYFSQEEINSKKKTILHKMEAGQVTLNEFKTALKPHFSYAWIIWNSGNFYEIVASNNKRRIELFLSLLPKPYVSKELSFDMPMIRQLL